MKGIHFFYSFILFPQKYVSEARRIEIIEAFKNTALVNTTT